MKFVAFSESTYKILRATIVAGPDLLQYRFEVVLN